MNRKGKIYISLPITGRDIQQVKKEAEEYRTMWEDEGFIVITPFDLAPENDKPYSYYMGKDIEGLLECNAIFLGKGWEKSKGCRAEYEVAKIYDKQVMICD